jgi:hypothetical protein
LKNIIKKHKTKGKAKKNQIPMQGNTLFFAVSTCCQYQCNNIFDVSTCCQYNIFAVSTCYQYQCKEILFFLNYGGADYIEKKFVDAAVYYHA